MKLLMLERCPLSRLVFDIETDLIPPTKIWCIVANDIDTKEQHVFRPDELDEGISLLQQADMLIGHNILGFDIPAIKKIKGVDLDKDKKIVDTLVLSRLFNPSREGRHTLDSWGSRLGLKKISFDDYSQFSEDMLTYCKRDVDLNCKVYERLCLESEGFSNTSIKLEHDVLRAVTKQIEKGFVLDYKYTDLLLAEMLDKMDLAKREVHKVFKPKVSSVRIHSKRVKGGGLSKLGAVEGLDKSVKLTDEEFKLIEKGPITRFEVTDFNLGSHAQIGEYLMDFGWEPKEFTPTGRPKVDGNVLMSIKGIPEAELISDYLTYQKREGLLRSWLKNYNDKTGRVHGGVNTNGTITGRMSHIQPNVGQVVSSSSPYGKECRSCWTVPENYKLVGVDASQLELRMLAHYMKDENYTNEIINGDIHTANQKLAGLESRNQAKTFIYTLLYGGSARRLGEVVGGSQKDGSRLRERFFSNLPSFTTLRHSVERAAERGFIKGLDGRKVLIRAKHAAFNSLLQSAGSIVMKKALVILDSKFKELYPNEDISIVANVHDEWQIESPEHVADAVGHLGVQSIKEAGIYFKLNCPMDGEYHVGTNWSETH